MTRLQLGWLAALMAGVLAVGGLGVFVVVNGEASSTLRQAQARYDDAWIIATAAADLSEHASVVADTLHDDAEQVVDDARTYQGVAGLDAAALADLTPLIAAVEELLAIEPPRATALPDRLESDRPETFADAERALLDWADGVDRAWADHPGDALADAVRALELAAVDIASDVAALGAGVLAATGGASAESRAALQSAMNAVAEDIAADRSPLDGVVVYAAAARAAQDSQAAAELAAANAAAAAAAEYDRAPELLCFDFPPITLPNGQVHDSPPACVEVPVH